MTSVHVLSVGFALAACAVPVVLLRRPDRRGLSAGEREQPVPPAIIRNAWIAYASRVSVCLPLFALGAAGDVWPAIAGAFGFGAGLVMLGALRRPVTAWIDEARRQGRPATLHVFVAQACGGAASVRLAAAAATVVALLGLAGAEAAALVVAVTPLVGEGAGNAWFVMLVAVGGVHAVSAGRNGVRYASQALLGAIHIGLFGSGAFLLYLHASDLRPMPPHGAFALIALTASSVAVLIYRQTKYVETPPLVAPGDPSRWRRAAARPVRWLLKLANLGISVLAVLVVVIAGMEFYVLGLPGLLGDGLAALGTAPRVPAAGIAGIAALALTYPLVDAVGWQSAGALAESARAAGAEGEAVPAFSQRPMRMVAGETAMVGVVVAALGAIAALAADLPPDRTGMPDVVAQLILFDNGICDAALTLLLVGIFAMAMSTTGMAVSTAMTVLRQDLLPIMRPGPGDPEGGGSAGRAAPAALCALAAAVAALWIASGVPSSGVADARFFAPALAFACLQLSLLPLVLARLGGLVLPGAGAALTVLGGGVAASLATIAIYGATADIVWLWLAAPACLASGLLLLAAAALRGRATTPPG